MRALPLACLALALLVALPPLAPAAPTGSRLTMRLVEGHTVYRPLDEGPDSVGFAPPSRGLGARTALATLDGPFASPPDEDANIVEYYPGLRWLNDQYLVDPVTNWWSNPEMPDVHIVRTEFSYAAALLVRDDAGAPVACGGAVLAVDAGAPDPRPRLSTASYVESYNITDPNDARWTTDVYEDASGRIFVARIAPQWAVEDARGLGPSTCAPVDAALARSVGTNGRAYPGREFSATGGLVYDAVLAFFGGTSTRTRAASRTHPARPTCRWTRATATATPTAPIPPR